MAPKHIALRTCVQCHQIRPKRELVRIVRTPEGRIEIDERGKMAGRGAYLCRRQACWEGGIQGDRLDHALKTALTNEDRERLRAYAKQWPASSSDDSPLKGDRDS